MPRISPKLVKQALRDSRLLPPLLRANPNLEQAKLELKWIKNELPKVNGMMLFAEDQNWNLYNISLGHNHLEH